MLLRKKPNKISITVKYTEIIFCWKDIEIVLTDYLILSGTGTQHAVKQLSSLFKSLM